MCAKHDMQNEMPNDSGKKDLPQNPCAFEIVAQLTPHSEILELTTEVISGKNESNADGTQLRDMKVSATRKEH